MVVNLHRVGRRRGWNTERRQKARLVAQIRLRAIDPRGHVSILRAVQERRRRGDHVARTVQARADVDALVEPTLEYLSPRWHRYFAIPRFVEGRGLTLNSEGRLARRWALGRAF